MIVLTQTKLSPFDSLRSGSKTFFFASFFLQKDVAEKAARLYQFCRYVDDLVDLSQDPSYAEESILTFSRDLDLEEPRGKEARDARALFRECGIPLWIPKELINGVRTDLGGVALDSEDELLRYGFRVAGTVGLMMCYVLGVHESTAHRHAVDLGIAMQLTNILRDVKEDALMHRVYIPLSWIPGIGVGNILESSESNADKRIVNGLARLQALSEVYYKSGFDGLAFIPLKSRYAILVAAEVYRNIGLKIMCGGYRFREERVVIPFYSKIFITIKSVLLGTLSKNFWFGTRCHENRLHSPIASYPFSSGL